jgi:hypothetical protein
MSRPNWNLRIQIGSAHFKVTDVDTVWFSATKAMIRSGDARSAAMIACFFDDPSPSVAEIVKFGVGELWRLLEGYERMLKRVAKLDGPA